MTSAVSDAMLRTLHEIATHPQAANGVRVSHDALGKAVLARGLVEKVFHPDSPWNHYRLTPEGEATLAAAPVKPVSPHKNIDDNVFAKMVNAGETKEVVMQSLGLSEGQYFYRLRALRERGKVRPRPALSGDAWAADRARVGFGPTVGSRADLLDAIGVDLLQTIAKDCPAGVTLMGWIAAIVKDAMNDEPETTIRILLRG